MFYDFYELSNNFLIPLLKIISLIFLIVVLYKLIIIFNRLVKVAEEGVQTVTLVNKSLEEIQYPLKTVSKISISISNIHDKTSEQLRIMKEFLISIFKKIMKAFNL